MIQKIRYGIIGCGSMGREHIMNIVAMDACVVTAIADTHPPSREAAQALLQSAATPVKSLSGTKTCWSRACATQVVIATPNFTHADIMRHALPIDVHLLIEKPLCATVADCADLVQREKDLQAKGRNLSCGWRKNTAICRLWPR